MVFQKKKNIYWWQWKVMRYRKAHISKLGEAISLNSQEMMKIQDQLENCSHLKIVIACDKNQYANYEKSKQYFLLWYKITVIGSPVIKGHFVIFKINNFQFLIQVVEGNSVSCKFWRKIFFSYLLTILWEISKLSLFNIVLTLKFGK